MGKENSRWTYTLGSRPEGCVVYDDDTKLHSHHDTDPARGQNSAYDLVRLHRFGHLDAGAGETPINDRPSSHAMVRWVNELPEIRAARARVEFEDQGPLPAVTTELQIHDDGTTSSSQSGADAERFRVHTASEFSGGPAMEWIVRGLLPRAELAFIYGEPGSGKTFAALDLCAAVARGIEWRGKRVLKGRVVYICAEGSSGLKARLKAYAKGHSMDLDKLDLVVISDAPNLLDARDAAAVAKAITAYFGRKPQ